MPTQARSIASLTLSFGLVAIPVKLYSATVSSERIAFHLLRKKDGSRLRQHYVAVNDRQLVERSDMVKGYALPRISTSCSPRRRSKPSRKRPAIASTLDSSCRLTPGAQGTQARADACKA